MNEEDFYKKYNKKKRFNFNLQGKWVATFLIIGILICIGINYTGRNKEKDTKASAVSTTSRYSYTDSSSETPSTIKSENKTDNATKTEDNANKETKTETKQEETKKEEKKDIPTEYKSALTKAKLYADNMNMSKQSIYEQLTSEYGEKFSAEAAQYAIDNLQVDYKQNALKKAQSYQESMSMSPRAIYDQLVSEYGEKFTAEEAQYAIDNLK